MRKRIREFKEFREFRELLSMGIFTESKEEKMEREKGEANLIEHAAKLTDSQLIMAMILEHDSASTQALIDHPLKTEAIKRCGYNPYS